MARKQTPIVTDYDHFVSYCSTELRRHPDDPALTYFDNRFYNRRVDNQTGHLRQAFYAGQEFFRRLPKAIEATIRAVDDKGRLDPANWQYLTQWREFVGQHESVSLPHGGSLTTAHKILPVSLGGIVTDGGGASPSFKIVLPLVARYARLSAATLASFAPIGADSWDDIDAAAAPQRGRFTTSRVIRDSRKSLSLKDVYQYRCQVCDKRIEVSRGSYYSECHHVRPLGGRHNGPDSKRISSCYALGTMPSSTISSGTSHPISDWLIDCAIPARMNRSCALPKGIGSEPSASTTTTVSIES